MTNGQFRHLVRQTVQVNAETILDALTQKQFTHPHLAINQALSDTLHELGVPATHGAKVLTRLGLNETMAIGRLRRCEIMQLSRAVHREWRNGDEA